MHDFQELLKHRKIFDDSLPTLYITYYFKIFIKYWELHNILSI